VDPKTGRPIENDGIRYDETASPRRCFRARSAPHSWQAMAFNPGTGLVYIPAQEIGMTYSPGQKFSTGFDGLEHRGCGGPTVLT